MIPRSTLLLMPVGGGGMDFKVVISLILYIMCNDT